MGGSYSKSVTIDISKHTGNIQKNDKGYYYEIDGGRVNLTEDWYPDPEGTYRKITHTPEKGRKIRSIKKGGSGLKGFEGANLPGYGSISVYYWSGDNSFSNPLLIQLGEGNNEYYKHDGGDNTWNKDASITTNTLKQKLDYQNCKKNNAHIVKIAEKPSSSTSYHNCPSCSQPKIQVYPGSDSYGDTTYYGHSVTSVTSFKYGNKDQTGLPTAKDVGTIKVYWNKPGETKPIFILYQTRQRRYFRRNKENDDRWIEVSNAPPAPNQASSTLLTTPNFTLNLSNTDGKYNYQGTDIKMAVLLSHIGDGYYRWQYSFRGSLFNVKSVMHGTTLNGISSTNPLLSVSAYYLGDSPNLPNLLMVELVISKGATTKEYNYFYRVQKDGNNWTELKGPGGKTEQLVGSSLKQALNRLKKIQFPEPSKDATTIIVGSSVGSGIGGTGLGGLAVWVWYKYFFDPVVRLV